MIDTHTHLYAEEFDHDRLEIIQKAIDNGVNHFLLPAIDSQTHEKMLKLEKSFPHLFSAMIGLHPCYVKPESWKQELEIVKNYLNQRKFCAIGEIGIDSIFLEGGQSLISQAFEENVIDAGEIFIANKILGDEKGKSFITGFDREKMDEAVILKNVKYNVYGENVGIEFLQKNYN